MEMQTNARAVMREALPSGVRQRLLATLCDLHSLLAAGRAPYEYIFVLSHMRAGSSLLAMILGNSLEICGYGETYLPYRDPADLRRLVGNNLFRLRPWRPAGQERYMLDKLVHNDLLAVEQMGMLRAQKAKFIFLLREPVGTIGSMMRMAGSDDTLAAALYANRLACLAAYGAELRGEEAGFLLDYEALSGRPQPTLAALSAFLGLKELLRTAYEVLGPLRGEAHVNHARLQSGRIEAPAPASAAPAINARNLTVAREAYAACQQTLAEVCVTPPRSS